MLRSVKGETGAMTLDPTSLKLFVQVVDHGTIAEVADREHLAAAGISRRLRDLEQMLGTELLVRTNRGITPTAAGAAFAVSARQVLDDLADLTRRMRDFSSGARGLVRLLANISAVSTFVPPLVASFAARYPGVRLQVLEQDSLAITEAVAENRADIGLFTSLPYHADIEVYPFRRDELKVLVPERHPLAARDSVAFAETLDHEHVVLRTGTHLRLQMLTAAGQAGRTLRHQIEVASYDALCRMVECGLGIGVVPAGNLVGYALTGTRTLALDEPWASRDLSLCVRRAEALPPAARLMFEHLLSDEGRALQP